jgi:hypothetical protein
VIECKKFIYEEGEETIYQEGGGGLGVQQEANIAVLMVNETSSTLNRCSARAATRRTRDNKRGSEIELVFRSFEVHRTIA